MRCTENASQVTKLQDQCTQHLAVQLASCWCAVLSLALLRHTVPCCADLSSVLAAALAELTSFLRKANRQLRQAALTALDVCGWHGWPWAVLWVLSSAASHSRHVTWCRRFCTLSDGFIQASGVDCL